MSSNLLEKAMSPEVLNQSWKMLKKEHTPWAVNVGRKYLDQNYTQFLLQCREEVLSGNYKPEPLRQFKMNKPKGGFRVISAHYLKDKLIQRALLILLQPKAELLFHNDSYAYRPGRGVSMAIEKVNERVKIGQCWLLDADISQFFDSIPINKLRKIIIRFVNDKQAMKLIDKWLKQGVYSNSFLSTARGISQGSILSPLFCNLYLNEFDLAMEKENIPFVRFADDFLLFSTTKEKTEKAKKYVDKIMSNLGLSLNQQKTKVIKSSKKYIFLGKKLPEYHYA